MKLNHPIEILETRIAPAVFFLSGTANAVTDSTGADINSAADATAVNSTIAVKLAAGDKLVLDTNGNHILDTGEVTFAKVTGGKAILFATNLDATAGFTANEITGLAVSNGFKAAITGSVNGSIVTALDKTGAYTHAVIQPGAIAGLDVSEHVTGSILAGKSISNVKIGVATENAALSVNTIATGSATGGRSVSFNGGGTSSNFQFTFAKAGEAGGSITNVTLGHGAANILAGNGNSNETGNGGAGGSISKLTFLDSKQTFQIIAGNGGSADAAKGKGGNGGTVTSLNITNSGNFSSNADITGGDGGNGDIAGAGGLLKGFTFNFSANVTRYLECNAGDGGNGVAGFTKGQGGNGGTTSGIKFKSTAKIEFVGIYGGDGGNAASGSNGKGGKGGGVSKVTYEALGGNYGPYFGGGDGGNGVGKGKGGDGGDVVNSTASVGDTDSESEIYGGDGGNGGVAGFGGRGGNVMSFNHSCAEIPDNNTTDYLWVYGGDGGDGGTGGGNGGNATNGKMTGGDGSTGFYIYGGDGGNGTLGTKGKGGNGGSITNVLVDVGASNDESQFFSGDGGDSKNANAGNGGSVVNFTVKQKRNMSNTFEISTGDGGRVISGDGNGGNGGALINSSFTKTSGVGLPNTADLQIYTGDGGNGSGKGNGGSGGAMTNFKLDIQSAVNELSFYTGEGGNAGATGKHGGNGGKMTALSIKATEAFGQVPNIHVGGGGDASGDGAAGGDSGSINGITVTAPLASIILNEEVSAGNGGTGMKAKGGNGGKVSGVKGTFGTLSIFAPDGGNSAGTGGNGGSITGFKATQVTNFVRLIKAGDGGNGDVKAGAGGSVSGTSVAGDIGDFASNFGIFSSSGNMGGLVAGQGGSANMVLDASKNGSILGVKATRISAILAGFGGASSLTADNAVKKISKITGATAIGADVNTNTTFDFTDIGNAGFNLGDGDTALDGLIIVKAPFTPPASINVLKLVTVV